MWQIVLLYFTVQNGAEPVNRFPQHGWEYETKAKCVMKANEAQNSYHRVSTAGFGAVLFVCEYKQ